jgi:hypothetical protein
MPGVEQRKANETPARESEAGVSFFPHELEGLGTAKEDTW